MKRVGYAQFEPALLEKEANLRRIEELLETAAADLIVLPELATTGYSLPDKQTALDVAEPIPGPTTDRLNDTARKIGGHLVVGLAERSGDRLYNSAVLLNGAGVVGVARKTHLFWNEKGLFDPGDTGFETFGAEGLCVGMMICFDWAFPEAAGTLARRGAHVIAHPSNLVLPYAMQAMPVRCLENRVFSVTCNRFGEEPGPEGPLRFRGQSMIIAPDGEVLASGPKNADELKIVEIDPLAAEDKKITPRNHLFEDRRPDLYGEE